MSEYPVPPNPAPDGLLVTPVWTTVTTPFDAMTEQRKAKQVFAKYDVSLKYPEGMTNADAMTLWAFYMARRGAYQAFYIYDLISVTHVGLFVGWGDGETTIFDLPGKSTSGHTIYIDGTAITLTDAGITDTVALADIRLSLADGTAFVDFSEAGTLTPYLNHKLTITDSAGKKATGYIKAAGTGETLGDELVSDTPFDSAGDWTAGASWVVSGGVATATASGGGTLLRNTSGAAITYKALYKVVINVASRTAGAVAIRYPYPGYYQQITAAAEYTEYICDTVSAGTNKPGIVSVTDTFSGTVTSMSVKQVLTPSATGVTITSTPGGTTYNWASIESGFNYNDASGYTYAISKGVVLTGGGAESSDRISLAPAPVLGKLITCDLTGYLRMRVRFKEDKFSRQSFTHLISAGGTIELKGLSPEDI